jgi:hypothetical protein
MDSARRSPSILAVVLIERRVKKAARCRTMSVSTVRVLMVTAVL